jgi:endoglucanase
MLFAWEQFQDKFKDIKLTMPENTNSMPDFLDEIKFEQTGSLQCSIRTAAVK